MLKNFLRSRQTTAFRWVRRLSLTLTAVMVFLAGIAALPMMQARIQAQEAGPAETPLPVETETPTPTASPTTQPTEPPTDTPAIEATTQAKQTWLDSPLMSGRVILALEEAGASHLFAYRPQEGPLTRLTHGVWDDITPQINPDGSGLAFASNRDGQWDLYWMDLSNGDLTRLTATPEYEANPTFSPDSRWLAYERYDDQGGGLEIFIRDLQDEQAPIRLTDHPAADHSPAWSPLGRQIAFVSNRSGEDEIWLADLDRVDDRFINLSRSPDTAEKHPFWSPDGKRLVWASISPDGIQRLMIWEAESGIVNAGESGSWPVWGPQGETLLTILDSPNQSYLTAYSRNPADLALPPLPLPGAASGLTWGPARWENLPGSLLAGAEEEIPALWEPVLTPDPSVPAGRYKVVDLDNVQAPQAMLHDLVDEAFLALRKRAAAEAGWDFLSSLENAFVPLTSPLAPGMQADWLYTGRAFTFNPLPINAGWIAVVREDYGPQTFWRIYLRTRFQDGSQGRPLKSQPWNFSARYSGDPRAYEAGGALETSVPAGFWIDFTELAAAYGWKRLPALSTWRSASTTARFNEFLMDGGLDWHTAMLEIYPPQALITPTAILPTGRPPTATPRPSPTPTPTRTPRPTATSTQ